MVGPGWLERLLAALKADPHHGLVGPSTNRSWNQQGIFRDATGTAESIVQCAQEASRRFGNQVRTLEPLYSLADFCYAVRREVIETIGLADEGYGLGPCWEMDYNIRAARAGWRGVWAGAAYVWRAPPPLRRQTEEAQLFQASKQRYQDKFCGGRLRGQKSDYRFHCRGDACTNFAPVEFQDRWRPNAFSTPVAETAKISIEVVGPSGKLVTCIMPTCNRRTFVDGAIRNFREQDYPNLELLIVHDGADSIEDPVPADPRIRYIRLTEKQILGDKRNFACAQACGEFICHWDDDDWYPANRVSRQVALLQSAGGQVCGTSQLFYYDPSLKRAWRYKYAGGGRAWVAGNTLLYLRSFWQAHPFASLQVGEDSRFVWADKQARICDLKDPTLCVGRVHPGNTSRKTIVGSCWQSVAVTEIHRLLGPDIKHFHASGDEFAFSSASAPPLVSCIMPTGNRRNFVRLALAGFQQQDYPARELIIVDDGLQPLSDLVAGPANVQYVRLPSRTSIGAKRNLACQKARGAIIAHWDDDDWYAPQRLSRQIEPLLKGEADLTGLESSYVLDLASERFWSLSPKLHERMFVGNVHGGTLVFRRSFLTGETLSARQLGGRRRVSASRDAAGEPPGPSFQPRIVRLSPICATGNSPRQRSLPSGRMGTDIHS